MSLLEIMRTTVIVLLVLALFILAACSKGNVLTGQAVAETDTKPTPVKKVEKTSEEPVSSPVKEEKEKEPVLGDVEEPDYSDVAGTCTTDGATTRHIDENGVKTVYRGDCFGDKLVKYGCDGNRLTTEFEKCSGECVVENYFAQCS